jgi:hypothetical protein
VTEIRQHYRDDSLLAILKALQAPTSPNTKESPTMLPMLKAYGVSLDDQGVHGNLLWDLYVLNKKHGNSNILYCKIRSNFTSSFVHVPSSKGFVRMKKNARKTKWLLNMLTALRGPGSNQESLLDKATWEEAVKSNGLVLPTLNGVTTRAIQSTCNMNKSQMRQLSGCLKAKLGTMVFSSEFKITRVLEVEYMEPTTAGTYKHGKEKSTGPPI